jgi:hypothetical protein
MNALVMTYLTIVGMLLLTTFPLLVPVMVTVSTVTRHRISEIWARPVPPWAALSAAH